MTRLRTYKNLRQLETFEERFEYLSLRGVLAAKTFGAERYLNQNFYRSLQWRQVRNEVIVRDHGRDLGIIGREIHDRLIIHHMNPMSIKDIAEGNVDILDPNYLISVTHQTHNAIHYGNIDTAPKLWEDRTPNDHMPWRKGR